MPQYIDSYYLVSNRKPELIIQVLDIYLPKRLESAIDYPVPLYTDKPEVVFDDVSKLLAYLAEDSLQEYTIYWRSIDPTSLVKHFMVFYTNDKKMIFGISIRGNDPTSSESLSIFNEVKKLLKAEVSCITVEEPPPCNSEEFTNFANNRISH